MGQAKQRGTFEQRRSQAQDRQARELAIRSEQHRIEMENKEIARLARLNEPKKSRTLISSGSRYGRLQILALAAMAMAGTPIIEVKRHDTTSRREGET